MVPYLFEVEVFEVDFRLLKTFISVRFRDLIFKIFFNHGEVFCLLKTFISLDFRDLIFNIFFNEEVLMKLVVLGTLLGQSVILKMLIIPWLLWRNGCD